MFHENTQERMMTKTHSEKQDRQQNVPCVTHNDDQRKVGKVIDA